MIKNIYDKKNKWYKHVYYCDHCLGEIEYGGILRNEKAIENDRFDLCTDCKKDWDEARWEKNNGSRN